MRALETAAATGRMSGRTELFIHRGFDWQLVDLMMTNFHLPRTTLLMMIDAFVGDALARPVRRGARRGLSVLVVRRRDAARPGTAPTLTSPIMHPVVFAAVANDGAARTGIATTARGPYRTPCFMPVGTRGAIKYLSADRLRAARHRDRARQHLPPDAASRRRRRRPLRRPRPVRRLGRADAHRLRWLPGLLALANGRRRRRHVQEHVRRLDAPLHAGDRGGDAGAARRRHPDGARRVPAAAEPARRRADWRSSAPPTGRCAPAPRTAGRTRRCSGSCRAAPTRRCGPRAPGRTVDLDFDGYGIGGLSVGETRDEMIPALAAALEHLPSDRPRYLMGVGDPAGLVEAVGLGVDQFDCVMQTRLGRHGTALTVGREGASESGTERRQRRADRREVPVRGVPAAFARLPPPPVPGRRADGRPAGERAQPGVDARPDGAHAGGDRARARSVACVPRCCRCGDSRR